MVVAVDPVLEQARRMAAARQSAPSGLRLSPLAMAARQAVPAPQRPRVGGVPVEQYQQAFGGGLSQARGGGSRGLGALLNNPVTRAVLSPLEALDAPRRVVLSGINEIADVFNGGDASWSDFRNQVADPTFGFGDVVGDTGNKWIDRIIGFAGDVAFDPLTYATLGTNQLTGAAGRSALAARAAAAGMSDDVVRKAGRLGAAAMSTAEREALGIGPAGVRFFAPYVGRNAPLGQRGVRVPGTGRLAEGLGTALSGTRARLGDTRVGELVRRATLRPRELQDELMVLTRGRPTASLSVRGAAESVGRANVTREASGRFAVLAGDFSQAINSLKDDELKAVLDEIENAGTLRRQAAKAKQPDPQITLSPSAKQVSDKFSQLRTIARDEFGVDIGDIDGYVPHLWTRDALSFLKGKPEAAELYKFIDEAAASGSVRKRLITPGTSIKVAGQKVEFPTATVSEINQKLSQLFPDAGVKKWLEDDLRVLTDVYISNLSKDAGRAAGLRSVARSEADAFEQKLDNKASKAAGVAAADGAAGAPWRQMADASQKFGEEGRQRGTAAQSTLRDDLLKRFTTTIDRLPTESKRLKEFLKRAAQQEAAGRSNRAATVVSIESALAEFDGRIASLNAELRALDAQVTNAARVLSDVEARPVGPERVRAYQRQLKANSLAVPDKRRQRLVELIESESKARNELSDALEELRRVEASAADELDIAREVDERAWKARPDLGRAEIRLHALVGDPATGAIGEIGTLVNRRATITAELRQIARGEATKKAQARAAKIVKELESIEEKLDRFRREVMEIDRQFGDDFRKYRRAVVVPTGADTSAARRLRKAEARLEQVRQAPAGLESAESELTAARQFADRTRVSLGEAQARWSEATKKLRRFRDGVGQQAYERSVRKLVDEQGRLQRLIDGLQFDADIAAATRRALDAEVAEATEAARRAKSALDVRTARAVPGGRNIETREKSIVPKADDSARSDWVYNRSAPEGTPPRQRWTRRATGVRTEVTTTVTGDRMPDTSWRDAWQRHTELTAAADKALAEKELLSRDFFMASTDGYGGSPDAQLRSVFGVDNAGDYMQLVEDLEVLERSLRNQAAEALDGSVFALERDARAATDRLVEAQSNRMMVARQSFADDTPLLSAERELAEFEAQLDKVIADFTDLIDMPPAYRAEDEARKAFYKARSANLRAQLAVESAQKKVDQIQTPQNRAREIAAQVAEVGRVAREQERATRTRVIAEDREMVVGATESELRQQLDELRAPATDALPDSPEIKRALRVVKKSNNLSPEVVLADDYVSAEVLALAPESLRRAHDAAKEALRENMRLRGAAGRRKMGLSQGLSTVQRLADQRRLVRSVYRTAETMHRIKAVSDALLKQSPFPLDAAYVENVVGRAAAAAVLADETEALRVALSGTDGVRVGKLEPKELDTLTDVLVESLEPFADQIDEIKTRLGFLKRQSDLDTAYEWVQNRIQSGSLSSEDIGKLEVLKRQLAASERNEARQAVTDEARRFYRRRQELTEKVDAALARRVGAPVETTVKPVRGRAGTQTRVFRNKDGSESTEVLRRQRVQQGLYGPTYVGRGTDGAVVRRRLPVERWETLPSGERVPVLKGTTDRRPMKVKRSARMVTAESQASEEAFDSVLRKSGRVEVEGLGGIDAEDFGYILDDYLADGFEGSARAAAGEMLLLDQGGNPQLAAAREELRQATQDAITAVEAFVGIRLTASERKNIARLIGATATAEELKGGYSGIRARVRAFVEAKVVQSQRSAGGPRPEFERMVTSQRRSRPRLKSLADSKIAALKSDGPVDWVAALTDKTAQGVTRPQRQAAQIEDRLRQLAEVRGGREAEVAAVEGRVAEASAKAAQAAEAVRKEAARPEYAAARAAQDELEAGSPLSDPMRNARQFAQQQVDSATDAARTGRARTTTQLRELDRQRGVMSERGNDMLDRIDQSIFKARQDQAATVKEIEQLEETAKALIDAKKTAAKAQPSAKKVGGKADASITELERSMGELRAAARQLTDSGVEQAFDPADQAKIVGLLREHAQALVNIRRADENVKVANAMLKEMRSGRMTSVFRKELRDGFELVGKDLLGGDGVAVTTEMAAALRRADKAMQTDEFWKMIDRYTQFFKTYATATPGFHVRNAISATFMNYADGVSGKNMRRGMAEWRNFMRDRNGYLASITDPQQRKTMEDALTAVFASGTAGNYSAEELGTFSNKLVNNFMTRMSRRLGTTVEGSVRLGMAIDTISRGGSVSDAIQRITKIHFDYSQVSEFDRKMKRLIPFWTFMSRNLPLQVQMLWTKPRAYAQYQSLVRNFNTGEDDDIVPLAWREQGAFKVGSKVLGGGRDDLYLAPDLPHVRLMQEVEKLGNPQRLLADSNPIIKAPLETLVAKRRFYSDQPFRANQFERVDGELGPLAPLLAALGLAETAGNGELVTDERLGYALRNLLPPLGQVQRLFPTDDYFEERTAQSRATYFGLPIRQLTPGAVDAERRRRERDPRAEQTRMEALANFR